MNLLTAMRFYGLTLSLQEASASTIEVHDDDPETFQGMMEFFYSNSMDSRFRLKGKDCRIYSNSIPNVLLPLIHLHALADKYDAKALQEATSNSAEEITKSYPYELTAKDAELMIKAHYPFCTSVMGDMGQVITKFILRKESALMRTNAFDNFVHVYANFGADLYFSCKQGGLLRV